MTTIPNGLDRLLERALKMERDGKEYFLSRAETAVSPLTKTIFQSLAADEDRHLEKIETIYQAVKNGGNWPVGEVLPPRSDDLKNVFERAKELAKASREKNSDYDALKKAAELEKESIVFYQNMVEKASTDNEKTFLQKIISEENDHFEIISNTVYYLFNTADFFSEEEKSMYE